jgi:AraC-like DNA-binding protein
MNAFTDFIRRIRLRASVYHNAIVCGDWQLQEYHLGVCCFHMVTQGDCCMTVSGEKVDLLQGDLVIFPREIPHSMQPKQPQTGRQQHLDYRHQEAQNGTGILCGAIRFQHKAADQLLNALPVYVVIPAAGNQSWLKPIYDLIMLESLSQNSTSSVILDRLSELVFMHGLQFIMEQETLPKGILALYGHSRLGLALDAIHAHPEKNWTLESLAKVVAVSRTQFSTLFRQLSGWTPMQYLTWWRMQIAADLLKEGCSMGHICDQIGYQSEAAFQRAFKSVMGISPGKYRSHDD